MAAGALSRHDRATALADAIRVASVCGGRAGRGEGTGPV
ncbi:hypothetical protein KIPE111705_46725 [Kibdelosporangium persicum]